MTRKLLYVWACLVMICSLGMLLLGISAWFMAAGVEFTGVQSLVSMMLGLVLVYASFDLASHGREVFQKLRGNHDQKTEG